VRQTGLLPLMKGHLLKWIGATEEGVRSNYPEHSFRPIHINFQAPAIYDTAGWVHILTKFRIPLGATWARVLDTNLLERREGKDESYWPVGITGSTFMCLILKVCSLRLFLVSQMIDPSFRADKNTRISPGR
jgi:chromosome transmission fidelity protein 4